MVEHVEVASFSSRRRTWQGSQMCNTRQLDPNFLSHSNTLIGIPSLEPNQAQPRQWVSVEPSSLVNWTSAEVWSTSRVKLVIQVEEKRNQTRGDNYSQSFAFLFLERKQLWKCLSGICTNWNRTKEWRSTKTSTRLKALSLHLRKLKKNDLLYSRLGPEGWCI